MKIEFPKILKAIALSEYAPEYDAARIWVWVNPPRDLLDEQARAIREHDEAGISAWYAEIWSQHADPQTHFDAAGVAALAQADTDPRLLGWLMERTRDLIVTHRTGLEKKLRGAADYLSQTGRTRNEMLADVLIAARVNRAAGGAVIAPWQVGALPREWIEACLAFTADRAVWRAGVGQIENAKARYRQSLSQVH